MVRGFTLVLGCLMLLAFHVEGQHKIDSLLQELKTGSKKKIFDVHLGLCYEYSDEVQVLYHAKLAFSIAKELKDSLGIIKAGRLVGRGYTLINQIDSSIYTLKYILPFAKGSRFTFEYGQLLNTLGVAYTHKASYAEALRSNFESLFIMEKLDNKQWISTALFNIGLAYYKIEDPGKALEYFKRTYQLKQVIHYDVDLDMLLIDMGLCYINLGKYREAEKYIKLALGLCKADCSDYVKLQAEYALGTMAFKQEKMAMAEVHFLRSYSLAKEIDNKRLQFDNIEKLSQIYQSINQLHKVERYLIEAEKLVPETSYEGETINLYRQFFFLYEKTRNLKKMALYQEKYIQLKDSVYSEDYTNSLMRVQAEYLERENKARIAAQQQMLDLKDEIIVRQNWLNILAGMVAMLLVCIVYVLYKSGMQRKIANRILDRKVEERTKELESSYNQLRKRLEEEDMAIGKIMADIKSIVASIKGLSSLRVKEERDIQDGNQAQQLNVVVHRLSEMLDETQNRVIGLSDSKQ